MDYDIRHLHPDELAAIEPIARDFFVEAKYPGKFAFDTFANFWGPMLSQGYGEIYVAERAGKVVGLVGGIFSPSLFNGELTLLFHFWFVRPEHRGSNLGIRLFETLEGQVKIRGASAALAGHILTINGDGFKAFFEKKGYALREMVYRKEFV